MSKIVKKIVLLLFISVFLFQASSCDTVNNLRQLDTGDLWLKSKDIVYTPCAYSVSAYALGDLYGKCGDSEYYEIQFESPEDFISEPDNIAGVVYRRSDIPEITLENFGAICAKIFAVGSTRIIVGEFLLPPEYYDDVSSMSYYEDGTKYTNAVLDAMQNGERVEYPNDIDEDSVFHIGLLSADYPGLVYTIIFFTDISGNAYLYDRSTRVCVPCPQIVSDYILLGKSASDTSDTSDSSDTSDVSDTTSTESNAESTSDISDVSE